MSERVSWVDGLSDLPEPTGPTFDGFVADEPPSDREQVCDWLRLHGIDPNIVPANATIEANPITRTLTVEVLVWRAGRREPNSPERRSVTVELRQTFSEFLAARDQA